MIAVISTIIGVAIFSAFYFVGFLVGFAKGTDNGHNEALIDQGRKDRERRDKAGRFKAKELP